MIGDTVDTVGKGGGWAALVAVLILLAKGAPSALKTWYDGRSGATEHERLTLEVLNDRFNLDNLNLRKLIAEKDATIERQAELIERHSAHIRSQNRTLSHQGIQLAELLEEKERMKAQILNLSERLRAMEDK